MDFTSIMATFREVRDLLAVACFEDIIDEDEFLLLWDLNTSKNLDFPYEDYGRFDLDEMDDSECLAEFRVKKRDLPDLAAALRIPDQFVCHQRSVADGMEGLCMLLRRLSYPCRYSDMIARFGRPVPVMSMVTNTVLDYIYTTHSHRILQWNQTILQPAQLQLYADAVSLKGAALNNCFGFIDGTVRPICRPGEHQRVVYNGHKRVHALKFQSIALPNGLIANMYGPVGKYIWHSSIFFSKGVSPSVQNIKYIYGLIGIKKSPPPQANPSDILVLNVIQPITTLLTFFKSENQFFCSPLFMKSLTLGCRSLLFHYDYKIKAL